MRAWLEIEMDNLLFNINKIREKVENREIMAVVKANSYGFGAKETVRYLSEHGVKKFAVACLDEALELRELKLPVEILILGVIFLDEIDIADRNDIQITVGNWDQIEYIKKNNLKVGVHIKIDTGMGRLGFLPEEGERVVEYCLANNINIVGIYSHLSDADGFNRESDNYTETQIKKFQIFEKYKDRVKYIHILNSGGILRFNHELSGNLVRAGICMYGMIANYRVPELKRVFCVKTKILSIRTVEEDSFISYGRKYTLHKGETYATIGVGYADGIKKEFSNRSYVIIENKKCPIIGEICMDMCMIDLTDKMNVDVGSEVEIFGKANPIEHMAQLAGTIPYELTCAVSKRVPRMYIKDGKVYEKELLLRG